MAYRIRPLVYHYNFTTVGVAHLGFVPETQCLGSNPKVKQGKYQGTGDFNNQYWQTRQNNTLSFTTERITKSFKSQLKPAVADFPLPFQFRNIRFTWENNRKAGTLWELQFFQKFVSLHNTLNVFNMQLNTK